MSGVIHPTPYTIDGSLILTDPDGNPLPGIANVTGELGPSPAEGQTSWGPYGPNYAIDFDTQRNLVLERVARGKNFSGVTRRLGRVDL